MAQTNTPVLAVRSSLLIRLRCFLRLWAMKSFVNAYIFVKTHIKKQPRHLSPTYTKVYPVVPSITNRVWIPSSYKSGDAPLPLYIDIHGGGWCIGAPLLDDSDCEILSNKHGLCVVSIGYRLAPLYPFPTPGNDVAALIQAVLDDPDLPVDKTKVAVGGYSAGGNLSLCAAQLNGLNRRIKGVVAYYPATNLVYTRDERAKLGTLAPGKVKDTLYDMSLPFNWGYITPGTDKTDPTLSPHFAKREDLPEKLYLLGCEYDFLCPEAKETAEKYGLGESAEKVNDSDNVAESWTKGSIRWRKVLKVEHGFNSIVNTMKPSAEKQRLLDVRQNMHDDVARWLKAEVYD